jgi:hypothetical protein
MPLCDEMALLAGLLRCGGCRYAMGVTRHRRRKRRRGPLLHVPYAARWRSSQRPLRGVGGDFGPSGIEEWVERQFFAALPVIANAILSVDRGDRVLCAREGDEKGVALGVDLAAAVRVECPRSRRRCSVRTTP